MAAFKTILENSYTLLLLTCVLCVSSVNANSSTYDRRVMEKRYIKWLETNGRRYRGRDDWEIRFGIYESNVQFIDYINSQNLSYKLTDNKFADMTNDEFKSLYLGRLKRQILPDSHGFVNNITKQSLPEQMDWRKEGAVTPVKDQGTCGSCWAFSAIAAVESLNKMKKGKLISLSEQELIDCDHIINQGCLGGLMEPAFEYIEKAGISYETDYPYTEKNGFCDMKRMKKHRVKIEGYSTVPVNDEQSLQAVVSKQPVSVAIDADSFEFQLYSSGVFDGFCGANLNHGVTVVGYGEDEGSKYWIVKNSWGQNWGEGGYIRMKRDSLERTGLCGIAMQASYPL